MEKKNQSIKILLLLISFVVSVLFSSCSSWGAHGVTPQEEYEYIKVAVVNDTYEELAVSPGGFWLMDLILPDTMTRFVVPAGMSLNVMARRDESIKAQGNSSGNYYDSQTYSRDWNTWAVR
jgi:hypothetical protein